MDVYVRVARQMRAETEEADEGNPIHSEENSGLEPPGAGAGLPVGFGLGGQHYCTLKRAVRAQGCVSCS